MEFVLIAIYALVVFWFAFWVIRLGVRYGVNDALKMNRAWQGSREDQDANR